MLRYSAESESERGERKRLLSTQRLQIVLSVHLIKILSFFERLFIQSEIFGEFCQNALSTQLNQSHLMYISAI